MARMGELLIAEGVLSEVALQSALGFQRHTGEPFRLGTILLDRDLLGEDSLLKALSAIHRCDFVTWAELLRASPQIVRLLPERAAVRLGAIPYGLEGRGVRVAFKNPSNLAAVDEVSAVTNRPVIPAVITEVRLLQALHLYYGRPVPIEFRSVLHKLERNEERRLFRSRAAMRPSLSGRPVPVPVSRRVEKSREIPIAIAGPDEAAEPLPAPGYAAPFVAAELTGGELADALDFLPDFAPPRSLTPEALVASLWMDEAPPPRPEPVPPPPPPPPPVERVAAPPRAASPVERSPARDRIAEAALDALSERFPRTLLLLAAQDSVQGWWGRGAGLSRGPVSSLRIDWGEPSVFAFVKLSGTAHRGPVSPALIPPAFAALLGSRAATTCAVYPVRIRERLVAFLYADRLGAPLDTDDYRALEVAASSLGSELARLLLELRKAVPA
jgi:hypothetical protein